MVYQQVVLILFIRQYPTTITLVELPDGKVKCPNCAASFALKQTVRVHLRTHFGVKLFHCDRCGKKFCHKEDATHHHSTVHCFHSEVLIKEDSKFLAREEQLFKNATTIKSAQPVKHKFACNMCSSSFPFLCHLKQHKDRVHFKTAVYKCGGCKYTSHQLHHLKTHASRGHCVFQYKRKNENSRQQLANLALYLPGSSQPQPNSYFAAEKVPFAVGTALEKRLRQSIKSAGLESEDEEYKHCVYLKFRDCVSDLTPDNGFDYSEDGHKKYGDSCFYVGSGGPFRPLEHEDNLVQSEVSI